MAATLRLRQSDSRSDVARTTSWSTVSVLDRSQ